VSRAAELRSYSEGNRDGKGIKLMATEGCGEARRWTFSCPTLTRWQEWCGVMLREREREIVAARKTLSETPWRTAGGGQCLGQSLIERAECSVMHQRHA